jgi:hypothetical protein
MPRERDYFTNERSAWDAGKICGVRDDYAWAVGTEYRVTVRRCPVRVSAAVSHLRDVHYKKYWKTSVKSGQHSFE